jgi:hypothetical protein
VQHLRQQVAAASPLKATARKRVDLRDAPQLTRGEIRELQKSNTTRLVLALVPETALGSVSAPLASKHSPAPGRARQVSGY